MIFWIYNDAGNIHAESQGDPINMEVQVQAFAYATNDEINDMTFQRYKLINRALEPVDSTHFAYWVDADLGCYTDDYIGSDTLRSLAYVYNEDAADGTTGCVCDGGVNTYCEDIPILGMDYFRGPLDENGDEIGMSSFTYFNNAGVDPPPPTGTTDPNNAEEYFRYLTGSWRDGNPFTLGDDAYQDGEPVKFAFPDAPNSNGWSMCSADLPPGDRRTVQASGPFRLDPGAINELIVGIVWVADQTYPCPSIAKLQEADDIAQALFDNCFDITDGPDAPDVDWVELDQEIIAVFTNDTITSNNAREEFSERGLQIPPLAEDSLYRFEGYKLFQLSGPDVTLADLDDVDKARLIYQVDIKNGVSNIFNWAVVDSPLEDFDVYAPTLMVEGEDAGIRHTFRITEDQFAEGDRRLINHRKYYFTALAYAFNEYAPFDPREILGQRQPYLEGRRNIGDGTNPFYTVIPRPIVDRDLNAGYGEGAVITRIDGVGNGGLFLDISNETRLEIEDAFGSEFSGEITYRPGRGPIEVAIFNPLDVVDGEFELTFVDENMANDELDMEVGWTLRNLSDPSFSTVRSEKTIAGLNEQIIKDFGFTISIGQTADAGEVADDTNGAIGYEAEYANGEAAVPWVSGVPDGFVPDDLFGSEFIFDYIITGPGQEDEVLDPSPEDGLSSIGPGYFAPYLLTSVERKSEADPSFISPAWLSSDNGHDIVRNQGDITDLNNVDIVLTSNKALWSRCVVVETSNQYYEREGYLTEGGADMMDLRQVPSVTKYDNDGDGLPDVDDPNRLGMGWFPGYAIDVETGQRLNIFFGENSSYDPEVFAEFYTSPPTGRDMLLNPTDQISLGLGGFGGIYNYIAGGQHFIYVTKTAYDECAQFEDRLDGSGSSLRKVSALREVTWAGFLTLAPGQSFRQLGSGETGLIPEDVTIKLRVDNPYQVEIGTGEFNGYPTYRFTLEGKQASELDAAGVENALDMINVVPNPYYGYSDYETSQFDNLVRITNLPAKCVITIYSLDGKFIRQYNRDELGAVPQGNNRALNRGQFVDFQEWDLRNNKNIPVASGVYLIHIDAEGLGERVIKWFGVGRQFDPSGL